MISRRRRLLPSFGREVAYDGNVRVQQRHEHGFTLIELLIVLAVIGILAAMATVRLDRARVAANEGSAIASLRSINAAESSYSASCGASGYAQSLADLAKAPAGSSQGFISPDLASNGIVKSGYVVEVVSDTAATQVIEASRACNAPSQPVVSGYFSSAVPYARGRTGHRSFASDKRATIYSRLDGAAIAQGMANAVPTQ